MVKPVDTPVSRTGAFKACGFDSRPGYLEEDMTTTYVIPMTCDLGATLPSVGEVVDAVNGHMADFGFHEKMIVRSEIFTMTLTTARPLTMEEKVNIAALLEEKYREALPDKDIRVAEPKEWR